MIPGFLGSLVFLVHPLKVIICNIELSGAITELCLMGIIRSMSITKIGSDPSLYRYLSFLCQSLRNCILSGTCCSLKEVVHSYIAAARQPVLAGPPPRCPRCLGSFCTVDNAAKHIRSNQAREACRTTTGGPANRTQLKHVHAE